MIAKKPNKIFSVTHDSQSTNPNAYKTEAKLAAANPFSASTNKTIEPAFFPKTRNVFVPDHRTLAYKLLASGTTPGGISNGMEMARMPFSWYASWGIPSALIGMAQGMAEAVRKTLIGKKSLFMGEEQTERVANQIKIAGVYADINAAQLVMRHRLTELDKWAARGVIPTGPEAFASNRDAAYVARLMGKVAGELTLMAGATSVYLTNPIQRFQRDINVGVTHVSLVWEEVAENYGRAVWELPPKTRK